jgi:hypothetical protein
MPLSNENSQERDMSSSETIEVVRDGRILMGATDLIYSPDDNGYYFHQANFAKNKCRTSAKVYPSDMTAKKIWRAGKVEWEPWR